jgi:hypothetical protein
LLTAAQILLPFSRAAGLQGFPPDAPWQILRSASVESRLADGRLELVTPYGDVATAIIVCADAMGLRARRVNARGKVQIVVEPGYRVQEAERMSAVGRYAIEFRSGTYFVNADRASGGSKDEALRFESRGAAEVHMRLSWLTWIAANGGMVVDLGASS